MYNMYKIIFSKNFKKHYKKRIPTKLDQKFKIIFNFLRKGPPFEKKYNFHQLHGEYYPCYSLNLTGDYRIVVDIDKDNKIIYLIDIGTHSQLYG